MEKVVERTTAEGTVVRLKVEALEDSRVRILECRRKPRRSWRFKRSKVEEGAILFYEELETEEPFETFFALGEAA